MYTWATWPSDVDRGFQIRWCEFIYWYRPVALFTLQIFTGGWRFKSVILVPIRPTFTSTSSLRFKVKFKKIQLTVASVAYEKLLSVKGFHAYRLFNFFPITANSYCYRIRAVARTQKTVERLAKYFASKNGAILPLYVRDLSDVIRAKTNGKFRQHNSLLGSVSISNMARSFRDSF